VTRFIAFWHEDKLNDLSDLLLSRREVHNELYVYLFDWAMWKLSNDLLSLPLRVCDHPFVSKCHGLVETPGRTWVIQDFQPDSLYWQLYRKGNLEASRRLQAMYSVCTAVEHLHSHSRLLRWWNSFDIAYVRARLRSFVFSLLPIAKLFYFSRMASFQTPRSNFWSSCTLR
jgi:hypothetical protein